MEPSIVIRPPKAEELPQVSKQIAESYKSAYALLMDATYLDSLKDDHWLPILQEGSERGDVCLIAEREGEVLGSLVYGSSEQDAYMAEWHAIYLAPSQIGQGLGHGLTAAMERRMAEEGFRLCSLEVLVDNHRAIRFHENHGYGIVDTFTVEENGMTLTCHSMMKSFE